MAKFFLGPCKALLQFGHFRIESGRPLCGCLFSHQRVYVIYIGSCEGRGFDPLPGSVSFAGQCIRGYYSYYDKFLKGFLGNIPQKPL